MGISSVKIFTGVGKNIKNIAKKCSPSKILKKTKKSKGFVQKIFPGREGVDVVQVAAGVLLGATGVGIPTAVALNSYSATKNAPHQYLEKQTAQKAVGRVYSTTA